MLVIAERDRLFSRGGPCRPFFALTTIHRMLVIAERDRLKTHPREKAEKLCAYPNGFSPSAFYADPSAGEALGRSAESTNGRIIAK
ncbi:MAG: hypothetical protein J5586_05940 [Clostridia bacterium]|nr:hypothetical protein [Clostridia bacterium]